MNYQHRVGCTAEPNKHALFSGHKEQPEASYRTVDAFLRAGNVSVDGTYQRLRVPSGFAYLTAHFTFRDREMFQDGRRLRSETCYLFLVASGAAARWLFTA